MEVCVVAVVVEYAAHDCAILSRQGFREEYNRVCVCEEIRVIMSVLDGLYLPVFLSTFGDESLLSWCVVLGLLCV